MSRRAPSIFDPESMLPGSEAEAAPAEIAPARKVGRPARTTAKPKPTPFYIHPAVKEILRDISYHKRVKEHDLFVQGLEHVLQQNNYPSIAEIISNAEKS